MIALARELMVAWRAHPGYDGNDGDPMVRAVCHHEPGPHGRTMSYTIGQLGDAPFCFRRIEKRHIMGEYSFCVEPIKPDDPLDEFCLLDCWDLPNKAGFNYQNRAEFKRRWPTLRRAMNLARTAHRIPAPRDPVTRRVVGSKRDQFCEWLQREGLDVEAQRQGVTPEEIWCIAIGKLSPADAGAYRQLEMQL